MLKDLPTTATEVTKMLVKHGHPSSRKIRNSFRVLKEAITELHDHFQHYHNFI